MMMMTDKEWKERQEKAKRIHQQNPILYYCDKIHGIRPDYEVSFEEAMEGYVKKTKKGKKN